MAFDERPAPVRAAGAGQPGARRDTVRRRKEIVAAAKQVFIERGLDGARTREIASAAGVTPTVMYRYFPTKDELFAAAVIEPLEDLLEKLYTEHLQDLASAPDAGSRKQVLLHQSRTWLETMDQIAPLLGAALFSNSRNGADFYRQRVLPAIQRLVGSLPATIRGWGGEDVDSEVLAFTIFGAYFTTAIDRYFRDDARSVDDLVPRLADQIVHGVMPRPAEAPSRRPAKARRCADERDAQ